MKFLSGFESTHIFGSGTDVLNLTNHTDLVKKDLRLASDCNLKMLRYPAPWHSIERKRGVYNWNWLDQALGCLFELGIEPIIDPLHHTSFPHWLEGGFANSEFIELYLRFVQSLAERYPWIKYYTLVNEPFVTALFCGHEGVWYPYIKSKEVFVRMILNLGEATCRLSRRLSELLPEVYFVHVDACEKHRARNTKSIDDALFRNELRFLVPDLILGKINEEHPLYFYLRKFGATSQEINWFTKNSARIDILGLDYYAHSELEWEDGIRLYPNLAPEGFTAVAMDYVSRYHLPVMLTETNIRGYISDRLSWLKFMVEQCEMLQSRLQVLGVPFHGFCWFPFIDSTDWNSLVCRAEGRIDPQGIYYLDSARRDRHASELSEIYALLASGKISSKDIPAYHFLSPVDSELKKFLPHMQHWKWQEAAHPTEKKHFSR